MSRRRFIVSESVIGAMLPVSEVDERDVIELDDIPDVEIVREIDTPVLKPEIVRFDKVLSEDFKRFVNNYKLPVSVSADIRNTLFNLYNTEFKIASLYLKNNPSLEEKKMIYDLKQERSRLKSRFDTELRTSNDRTASILKNFNNILLRKELEEFNEYKNRLNANERIEEGVAIDDIVNSYYSEGNHMRGVLNDLMSIPLMMKKNKLVNISYADVCKMIPSAKDAVEKYEEHMRETYTLFDTVFNKLKNEKVGEKTLKDAVEVHPDISIKKNDALQLFGNKVMYIRSDTYLNVEKTFTKDSSKEELSEFAEIISLAKKIVSRMQKFNQNNEVVIKLHTKRGKNGVSYIMIAAYIKTSLGTAKDGQNKDELFGRRKFETTETTKTEESTNEEEKKVSPEFKRIDMIKGDIENIKDEIEKTSKKIENGADDIYSKKLDVLNKRLDKKLEELHETEKRYEDEKKKLEMESVYGFTLESREMEEEIKPIVDTLNKKGYTVKYASPGHKNLKKKEDVDSDKVYYDRLYSDARIMFDNLYEMGDAPKYWYFRVVDGCTYLDITPFKYDKEGKDSPDKAFDKWKVNYMNSLKNYVEELPNVTQKIQESLNEMVNEIIGYATEEVEVTETVSKISDLF